MALKTDTRAYTDTFNTFNTNILPLSLKQAHQADKMVNKKGMKDTQNMAMGVIKNGGYQLLRTEMQRRKKQLAKA